MWKNTGILNKSYMLLDSPGKFKPWDVQKYIFKPNVASGSRGITILADDEITAETLYDAFRDAAGASLDGKVLVEEFCEGTEFTVELLGDA